MTAFSCSKCGKEFAQKSHYNQHLKRKTPCISDNKLKEMIVKLISESGHNVEPKSECCMEKSINYDIKSMRYLGNKTRHLAFIFETMTECFERIGVSNPVVFDAFGGTGTVSQFLNINDIRVVSNDMNNYSYRLCCCRNSITKQDIPFCKIGEQNRGIENVIAKLNTCKLKGFVYDNYSPNSNSTFERRYLTNENAEIIDGMRAQIEEWFTTNQISLNEHTFLIALLIESVSLYSNIPGTYGAFNATWDPRSTRTFALNNTLVDNLLAKNNNQTYNSDIKHIVADIKCDVLYVDPPYNERDYSMYYHVLETISLYNNPELNDNKTGTKKSYTRSNWCMKKKCLMELEYIVKNTTAKCIIMSYNNEGIMKLDEIERVFKKYGIYTVKTKQTRRFKCNDKNNDDVIVNEYLHVLVKNDDIDAKKQSNGTNEETNQCVENTIQQEHVPVFQINKIQNTCCIDGMRQLPDNIIDLICVDLPYGLTECKWDTPINLDELWTQYKRILKPYGTIVLFGQQPFTSRLVSSNYAMFKYSLVWQKSKPGGFAQAPYKVLCEHEDILVFSYGKTSENAKNKMIYNPQGTIPCNKIMKGKTGNTEHRENRKTQSDYIQTTSNYPRSVLKFNNEGKTQHPTQKPLALITYLINTFSNRGDIVMDSCMGSGTTAVACLETDRQFIGYELDKKYFDIASTRIATFAPTPDKS